MSQKPLLDLKKQHTVEVEVEYVRMKPEDSKLHENDTCSVEVWLDTGNNRTEQVHLSETEMNPKPKELLKLDNQNEIDARKLRLHVSFYKNHRLLGQLMVPLGTCLSVEDINSIEVKPPVSGYDASLTVRVKEPEEFLEFISYNLNGKAWKELKGKELAWLAELRELAEAWKNWKGVAAFIRHFTPAQTIAEASFRMQRQRPWLAGHSENLIAGPGIVYAVHVNGVALLYYCLVLYMFGFVLIPGCFGELPARTIVPTPWTFYFFYLVPGFLKLYCEFAVLGCILPVKVLGGGVPKAWWKDGPDGEWPVGWWVAMKVMGSLAASLDVFSSSIFLSRVVAQHRLEVISNHSWTMEDPWLRSLETTRISIWNVFKMFGGFPKFEQLVWLLWLTVFVQVLWAFAYSIPITKELQSSARKPQKVWYDLRRVRSGDGTGDQEGQGSYMRKRIGHWDMFKLEDEEEPKGTCHFTDFAEYHTALVRYQVHGRALVALLKSARLSMGLARDSEYVVRMVEHWKPKDVYDYQRQSSHFFIIFMIQRVLTTSVQASFIGISKNLTGSMDLMTFMSVLLGCALGLSTIYSEVALHYDLWKQLCRRAQNAAEVNADKRQKHDVNFHRGWSTFTFLYTFIFAFVSFICFLYCASKAYAGLLHCPCGLMNVGFHGMHCVNFTNPYPNCTMGADWTGPETIKSVFPDTSLFFWQEGVPNMVCSVLFPQQSFI